MKQINFNDVIGKTIKGFYCEEDYITHVYDDGTYSIMEFVFDSSEGYSVWENCWVDKYFDENMYVKAEHVTNVLWADYDGKIKPCDYVKGLFTLGIIRYDEEMVRELIHENKIRVKKHQKETFYALAKEFGITISKEQEEDIDKFIESL